LLPGRAGIDSINTSARCRRHMDVHVLETAINDDELASLVARAKNGSGRAFEELAATVRGRVRRWAAQVVGDPDDADDVTQLVLMRVAERLSSFDGRSRFSTWLYRVTRRVALNRVRTEERRRAILARSATTQGTAVEQLEIEHEAERLVELVRAYYAELTPRQREVFEMADLQQLSGAEIARRLGIDPSTVRVLLLQARRTIRRRMLRDHAALVEAEGYDV
jgi:RNA polymerase sigma factor (sigma-70 family)